LYYIHEGIIFLREGFFVCKVNGSSFPSGGIQGACNFSKRVQGVGETFSKCRKFSSVEKCSSNFLIQSVWKRVVQVVQGFNVEV
jgi:hypothetical protein